MKKVDKYILLGVVILLIVSIIGVYIFKFHLATPGATAIITQNGHAIHRIDLNAVTEPYELNVETENNGYNTIYIEKNKIKFSDANCPDKLCVQTGFLSSTNDISVCLPHGLFIEIEGGTEGDIDILAH
ncbi:MAG TPA: NusG domain II-containing protein [Epulopiscium sp.]|nr:NusG domain II-containing protein [Candidatus Epulonipiscium sp.]